MDWHAGIDLAQWTDTRDEAKNTDVIIYDKIRWERERWEPELLRPIMEALVRRKLSYAIVRYGSYDYAAYRELLRTSRSMIFLCEHETQGMAYQECLASNVPIIAWDNGFWRDPMRERYESEPVAATSVPYFSSECGERFQSVQQFSETLDLFLDRLPAYQPREYVRRELSFERSAELYVQHYGAAGRSQSTTREASSN